MEDDQDSRAAIASAEARGVTRERQRVAAHLTMGESCGDMSIALECIRSGAEMTVDVQARYMAAGMNRADRQRRQVESNTAEAVLEGTGGATSSASAPDLGDQVVAELTKKASFVRG
jgi:hypothetical protein